MKHDFCAEVVRKCIYCCFWNTVVFVHDFIVRYSGPQKYFQFTKSGGNLEILTSIYPTSMKACLKGSLVLANLLIIGIKV